MPSILRRPVRYRYFNATIVLVVVNVIVFLLGYIGMQQTIQTYLGLTPIYVVQLGAWWQIVTYMFVHQGFLHIFGNMLALFIFGIQLEQRMGSTDFLLYYFVSGIGAGIATLFVYLATGHANYDLMGASGAVFAVLLAFASFFPDARIFVFGILPIRAPILVLVYAGFEIFATFTNVQSGVAHLTHLFGLVFGWLFLMVRYGMNAITIFFRRR